MVKNITLKLFNQPFRVYLFNPLPCESSSVHLRLPSTQDPYNPCVSIHFHNLTILEDFCDILNPDNAGLTHLTGNRGPVLKRPAGFEQHPGSIDKERRPARVGSLGHQDVPGQN